MLLPLFRRDQIWFTQRNRQDCSTDLYSLYEIKDVGEGENFEKGYRMGKYGQCLRLLSTLGHGFLPVREVGKKE